MSTSRVESFVDEIDSTVAAESMGVFLPGGRARKTITPKPGTGQEKREDHLIITRQIVDIGSRCCW
jgi:hypothetical protein